VGLSIDAGDMPFPPPPGDVFVIAEVGVNHEGSVETCVQMIDAAKASGADAIKLQTIDPDANYVSGTESHQVFSQAFLDREQTSQMFAYANDIGLSCFTTAGDFETLDWVERLEPVAHKISSGLLTHTSLIRRAAESGRPIILSTGLSDVAEVEAALAAVGDRAPAVLLQCTSIYPAPVDDLNLRAIDWMSRRFGVPCGFSDHSLGTEASVLAVAAGAMCIEKHFTLDPDREGMDHQISLSPGDFRLMVDAIRCAQRMMGVAGKPLSDELMHARARYLRCIVASEFIPAGTELTAQNIAVKRPLPDNRGLAADMYESVLGRRAASDLEADTPITALDVEGQF
jgi:N,N'-diacetyllegionaminate synthase